MRVRDVDALDVRLEVKLLTKALAEAKKSCPWITDSDTKQITSPIRARPAMIWTLPPISPTLLAMNARPVSMPAFVDIHMSIPNHWKRILVPTDFSEDALTAMLEAQRFQQHSEAEVVLLHVTEPAFEGLRIHSGDLRDQMAAARHQIEALAIAYFGSKDSATTLIKEGHAGEVICEMARELNADVIFIATQGITALKHFMLGSVAESVVRHAPCSVLVVR